VRSASVQPTGHPPLKAPSHVDSVRASDGASASTVGTAREVQHEDGANGTLSARQAREADGECEPVDLIFLVDRSASIINNDPQMENWGLMKVSLNCRTRLFAAHNTGAQLPIMRLVVLFKPLAHYSDHPGSFPLFCHRNFW
jgi:hypothetical protein